MMKKALISTLASFKCLSFRQWRAILGMTLFILQLSSQTAQAAVSCRQLHKAGAFLSAPAKNPAEVAFVSAIKSRTLEDAKTYHLRYQGFLKAIEKIKNTDPDFAKLWDMFENKEYSWAMDRSPQTRQQVLKNGFLNIHEANRSAGVNRPDQRNHIEAQYLGMETTAYEKIPASMKPKSMYLVPNSETGIQAEPTPYFKRNARANSTGDTWVFDLKQIEENTFFVVGDSSNRALIMGDLIDDYQQFTTTPARKFTPGNPVNYILPGDLLPMSIPFFYEQVKNANTLRFVDRQSDWYRKKLLSMSDAPDWQQTMADSMQPDLPKLFKSFPSLRRYQEFLVRPYANYVEGMYYGALPVTKVRAFIYRSQPPTPAELRQFEKFGIEVIDGRQ